MKKRICILLCAAMILSAFGGCGGSTQAQASESAAASEAASVSAAEADSEGNGISIRHPLLKRIREGDLLKEDCTLAKIFNEA